MRAVFLFLVLANLAFLAWTRHASSPDPAPDNPLAREVHPNKLKPVPPPQLGNKPTPPKPDTPPAAQSTSACLEWGPLAPADARRAERLLEPLALGERLGQRRTEEVATWWVFMPPQGSRQAALRKSAELKALGVSDYYIIAEDAEWRWALSLGVFRSEESAQARLASLRARGVRSANVAPRETVVPKVWLRIQHSDPALQMQVRNLAATIEGSDVRACP